MAEETKKDVQERTQNQEKKPDGYYVTVKIGVRPGFILRKVGEAYMVMPTGPRMKEYKGMITLNETGAVLFKASQQPNATRQSLIDALIKEYGVDEKEAGEAVYSFVQQCAQTGIFECEKIPIYKGTKEEEK